MRQPACPVVRDGTVSPSRRLGRPTVASPEGNDGMIRDAPSMNSLVPREGVGVPSRAAVQVRLGGDGGQHEKLTAVSAPEFTAMVPRVCDRCCLQGRRRMPPRPVAMRFGGASKAWGDGFFRRSGGCAHGQVGRSYFPF